MKKVALLILLVFPSCFLDAQTNKGDQLVSGLINARIYGNRYFGGVNTSVSGIYQYFIFKNFSVGAGIEYGFRSRNSNPSSYRLQSFYFLPEARYYFLNGKFRPYIYANGGAGFYTLEGYGALAPHFKYGAGVGFNWFLSDRFALESRFGVKGHAQNGSAGLTGWDFKIGVSYSIPFRKKKTVPPAN
jgi:hypothetical protein